MFTTKKNGFSLLELLVVMAIIVIVTAASLPSFLKFTKTARLRAAARDITSALRTARRYAITKRKDYPVVVCMNDLDTSSYSSPVTVTLVKNAVTFYDTADTVELKHFPITVKGREGDDDGLMEFTFSSRGTAGSGGEVRVENDTDFMEIKVLGVTGRVRIGSVNEDFLP